MRFARPAVVALALSACLPALAPATASAGICGAVGWVSGVAGKTCTLVSHGDRLISAGKKAVTGHPGAAVKTVLGGGGGSSSGASPKATAAIALAAILTWTVVGAKFALRETAKVISKTTSPQLTTTWFSSTYWRIAGISALLTLPFLFAAGVQALLRSDLALLARAAFGYLPLSLLAVGVAAPVTMLLLAASDEMSALVSSAAGNAGSVFLGRVGLVFGTLSLLARAPFLVFLAALLTAAAALALWIEMLMREAAVYIVVLMLPLAFAAMVWPARRVWAIRTVELLVALILSKFAIVAVLALGGAALGQTGSGGAAGMLTGLVLVLLAAFAPWALLRLLPLAEVASSAAGHLRGELGRINRIGGLAGEAADRGSNWAGSIVSGMRADASAAGGPAAGGPAAGGPAAGHSPAENAAEGEVEKLPDEPAVQADEVGGGEPEPDVAARADGSGESNAPERPDMDPRWSAPDMSWKPVVLGPEGYNDPPDDSFGDALP